MNWMHRLPMAAAIALLCLHLLADASTLAGVVVGVADGDTVTVLDAGRQQHRVRLAGIDAPEKEQPFSQQSKQHLARLVFQSKVAVEWEKRDRYGRIVGKVFVGSIDAGLHQLRAGMAWHFKRYEREQSPEDRVTYAQAEGRARASRAGLWAGPDPLAPWEFRRMPR